MADAEWNRPRPAIARIPAPVAVSGYLIIFYFVFLSILKHTHRIRDRAGIWTDRTAVGTLSHGETARRTGRRDRAVPPAPPNVPSYSYTPGGGPLF
jgi:hypothetical protein